MDKMEILKKNICDNYCKYPLIWNEEKEGIQLSESEICSHCPLNELNNLDEYQINIKLKYDGGFFPMNRGS